MDSLGDMDRAALAQDLAGTDSKLVDRIDFSSSVWRLNISSIWISLKLFNDSEVLGDAAPATGEDEMFHALKETEGACGGSVGDDVIFADLRLSL